MNGIDLGKYKKYIICVVTCVSVIIFVKYLLPLVMPFFVALCIVAFAQPALQKLEKKLHIKKSILAGFILLLACCGIGAIVWYFGQVICVQAGCLADNLRTYQNCFCDFVHRVCCGMEKHMGIRSDEMEKMVFEQAEGITRMMRSQALPRIMNHSMGYMKIIGRILAFVGISFIATILLAKDYQKICRKLERFAWFREAEEIGGLLGKLAGHYLKAQGVILCVISGLCIGGLWAMGIRRFFLSGILAGALDAMPFIGTGFVLVPTALWQLIQGNIWQSIGVFVLYGVCILAREFLEPKLIGRRMNLYPIVVLLSIYLGIKLYGLSGVIFGPFSFLIIREIWRRILCEND